VISVHRARWVLPVAQPPLEHGWVAVENGRILALGGRSDTAPSGIERREAHAVAILPALVNAHVHLELSWMRNRVAPAPTMPQWVERLMAVRRTVERDPPEPIVDAIRELRAAGTGLVGEITNTLAAYDALANSDLAATVFRELIGFNVADVDAVVAAAREQVGQLRRVRALRTSIVPHAPYSVAPLLMSAIASASADSPMSIHLGESAEEIGFLRTGTGPWRDLLIELGVWTDSWRPPGVGPVDYIARHGLVNERLLAVHCVQLTDEELGTLTRAGATVVTCPRSNLWVGAGPPPIARFYASGVRVAVGTDSLASVGDLNLFSELESMRALAPSVAPRDILASATKQGADALGFGDELGTIEAGKRAELIAVRVPDDLDDVEEYLLSGIEPTQVSWL
jgi:cytosine/adenosine deaminase-related metal-dependent hydrolase